jgi:prolyl-tRNA synthetase
MLAVVAAFAGREGLDAFTDLIDARIERVARAARVSLIAAAGVAQSRSWLALNRAGRSAVLRCDTCGLGYEHAAAPVAHDELPPVPLRALERVHTPNASTIQALADMLGVGSERTLKALFLSTERDELVFAVIRGDLDVSLDKLGAVVGSRQLRPSTEVQITAAGAVPGFASPIGLNVRAAREGDGVYIIADPSAWRGRDFAAGANAPEYHFVHVDPRRDFSITQEADITLPPTGARCATCGFTYAEQQGTIIARWVRLPPATYAAEGGGTESAPAAMLTLDLLATLEHVVAACTDESGIAWPALLAPADIHVVDLKAAEAASHVAGALQARGLRVLLDDRPLAAGAKFTDADLIGCPLRLTISPRSLQAGGGELSGRRSKDPSIVPLAEVPEIALSHISALMST